MKKVKILAGIVLLICFITVGCTGMNYINEMRKVQAEVQKGNFQEAKELLNQMVVKFSKPDDKTLTEVYLRVVDDTISTKISALTAKSIFKAFVYSFSVSPKENNINELKQALEYTPNYDNALYLLGSFSRMLGNDEDAVACYKKTLAVNPDYAEAYYDLGLLYAKKLMFKEATDEFESYLARSSNPYYIARAHFSLAVLYEDDKKYDLAITHYDKAMQLGEKPDRRVEELLKPYRK